jgi:hypothetical protein
MSWEAQREIAIRGVCAVLLFVKKPCQCCAVEGGRVSIPIDMGCKCSLLGFAGLWRPCGRGERFSLNKEGFHVLESVHHFNNIPIIHVQEDVICYSSVPG